MTIRFPQKLGQGLIKISNEVSRLLLELDIAFVIVGIHVRACGAEQDTRAAKR